MSKKVFTGRLKNKKIKISENSSDSEYLEELNITKKQEIYDSDEENISEKYEYQSQKQKKIKNNKKENNNNYNKMKLKQTAEQILQENSQKAKRGYTPLLEALKDKQIMDNISIIVEKYKDLEEENRPSRSYTLLNDLKLINAMGKTPPPYSSRFFNDCIAQGISNRSSESLRDRYKRFLKNLTLENLDTTIVWIQKRDSASGYFNFIGGRNIAKGSKHLSHISVEDPFHVKRKPFAGRDFQDSDQDQQSDKNEKIENQSSNNQNLPQEINYQKYMVEDYNEKKEQYQNNDNSDAESFVTEKSFEILYWRDTDLKNRYPWIIKKEEEIYQQNEEDDNKQKQQDQIIVNKCKNSMEIEENQNNNEKFDLFDQIGFDINFPIIPLPKECQKQNNLIQQKDQEQNTDNIKKEEELSQIQKLDIQDFNCNNDDIQIIDRETFEIQQTIKSLGFNKLDQIQEKIDNLLLSQVFQKEDIQQQIQIDLNKKQQIKQNIIQTLYEIYQKEEFIDINMQDIQEILDTVSWNVLDLDKVIHNLFNNDLLEILIWTEDEDKQLIQNQFNVQNKTQQSIQRRIKYLNIIKQL